MRFSLCHLRRTGFDGSTQAASRFRTLCLLAGAADAYAGGAGSGCGGGSGVQPYMIPHRVYPKGLDVGMHGMR